MKESADLEALVVDSSFLVAFLVAEEHSGFVQDVMEAAETADLEAPGLIAWELANVLQMKVRRRELAPEDRDRMLARLEELPVLLHPAPTTPELWRLAELSGRHALTAYDAAYLTLSLQLRAPLATLDAKLANAARIEGLAVHCPF